MIESQLTEALALLPPGLWMALVRALTVLAIGLPVVYVASGAVSRLATRAVGPQRGPVAGVMVRYGGFVLILLGVMHELGFKIAPLLGAAGILGVAIGFASQTSVSNIISGLFLIAESPFAIDDTISVGDITGQVLSIDLLSVKIRTNDNKMVRIPNETIIKTTVTNVTRFGIRRVDIKLTVGYDDDLAHVRELLVDVARANPLCLREPEPAVQINGFVESGIELLLAAWVAKNDFRALRLGLHESIRTALLAAGVRPAVPRRAIQVEMSEDSRSRIGSTPIEPLSVEAPAGTPAPREG